MADVLGILSNLFSAMFILGSMISAGLSLRWSEIVGPLKHGSVVWRSLLTNFLLIPLWGYAVVKLFGLTDGRDIAIAVLAICAGAPVIPVLVRYAGGDVPRAVGVMMLLTVVTIVYVPLVMPLLLPNVEIDAVKIAVSLTAQILLPLALALLYHEKFRESAKKLQPIFDKITQLGLLGMVILTIATNFSDLTGLFGTGVIFALCVFILGSVGIGMIMSGEKSRTEQAVFGFSAGQRNIAAAFIIASGSLAGNSQVMVTIVVAAILMNIVLIPLAKIWSNREGSTTQTA